MSPEDPINFDSVHILPEDWDELVDGEIDIAGMRLEALADSVERI